jgi:single-stranded-DNA-specific exonuclease
MLQKILSEALEIINRDRLFENEVIIVAKENWHHGVIGIVSSKITEKYLTEQVDFNFKTLDFLNSVID